MSLSSEQKKKLYADDAMDGAHQRSYDSREAGSFKDIFNKAECAKYGLTFFKPASTEHLISILPYLAGKQAPYVQGIQTPEGTPTYLVDVWVHRNVGPNEDQYICLAKSYNKPCPICEARKSVEFSPEELDEMRPKRRTVYAVLDRDAETKGVQIWEVAHWYMERKLQARAKRPRGGGYIHYSHAKRGKDISFTITAMGKNKEYDGHDFVDRDEPISEEILAKVPPMDELIHIPSYAEVQTAFLGGRSSEEPEPERNEEEHEEEIEKEEKVEKKEKGEEKKTKAGECPIGVVFGKDFDGFEECDTCVVRLECKEANETVRPTPRRRRSE